MWYYLTDLSKITNFNWPNTCKRAFRYASIHFIWMPLHRDEIQTPNGSEYWFCELNLLKQLIKSNNNEQFNGVLTNDHQPIHLSIIKRCEYDEMGSARLDSVANEKTTQLKIKILNMHTVVCARAHNFIYFIFVFSCQFRPPTSLIL